MCYTYQSVKLGCCAPLGHGVVTSTGTALRFDLLNTVRQCIHAQGTRRIFGVGVHDVTACRQVVNEPIWFGSDMVVVQLALFITAEARCAYFNLCICSRTLFHLKNPGFA